MSKALYRIIRIPLIHVHDMYKSGPTLGSSISRTIFNILYLLFAFSNCWANWKPEERVVWLKLKNGGHQESTGMIVLAATDFFFRLFGEPLYTCTKVSLISSSVCFVVFGAKVYIDARK